MQNELCNHIYILEILITFLLNKFVSKKMKK